MSSACFDAEGSSSGGQLHVYIYIYTIMVQGVLHAGITIRCFFNVSKYKKYVNFLNISI